MCTVQSTENRNSDAYLGTRRLDVMFANVSSLSVVSLAAAIPSHK